VMHKIAIGLAAAAIAIGGLTLSASAYGPSSYWEKMHHERLQRWKQRHHIRQGLQHGMYHGPRAEEERGLRYRHRLHPWRGIRRGPSDPWRFPGRHSPHFPEE
jgi:hypothetical protein